MSRDPQTFENHARFVPGYHYVLFALLLLALVWEVSRLLTGFSVERLVDVVLVVALVLTASYARTFPLGVQNRLIRLEERLRMQQLLPDDLKARVPEFTTPQLIALRFASDAELPDLARRVLEEGIVDRKAVKKLIRHWRADHERI